MNILCLCPTYGRPRLVANALACFLAQDFPRAQRHLLILDDAGQIDAHNGYNDDGNWTVISTPERFESLPEKYNAMLGGEGLLAPCGDCPQEWDAIAVWDDDDVYLPWHLSAAAAALKSGEPSAKPSAIWSLYASATPRREDATGRFHGSLVISVDRLRQLGGWINTRRADFDQQMITTVGPAAEMLVHSPQQSPSYIYRWGSTQAHHCSAWMRTPADESWYARTPITEPGRVERLVPQMDEETQRMFRLLALQEEPPH